MGMRVIPRLASVLLLRLACGISNPDCAGAPGSRARTTATRQWQLPHRVSAVDRRRARSKDADGARHDLRAGLSQHPRQPYSSTNGLATLLRIDNTSSTKPLVLERIDYFDTAGKLVQRYLTTPIALKPFGAIQIFVPADDARGGPATELHRDVVGQRADGGAANRDRDVRQGRWLRLFVRQPGPTGPNRRQAALVRIRVGEVSHLSRTRCSAPAVRRRCGTPVP